MEALPGCHGASHLPVGNWAAEGRWGWRHHILLHYPVACLYHLVGWGVPHEVQVGSYEKANGKKGLKYRCAWDRRDLTNVGPTPNSLAPTKGAKDPRGVSGMGPPWFTVTERLWWAWGYLALPARQQNSTRWIMHSPIPWPPISTLETELHI